MRPRIFINFALTANGRMANPDGSQLTISNPGDKKKVHELRNTHDAILVGINTVMNDDPKLTVKEEYVHEAHNPTRIILDSKGCTPDGAVVLDGKARTIIVTNETCTKTFHNAEVIRCGRKRVNLARLLPILHGKGIETIMVEGGATVIQSFLEGGMVDGMRVFVGGMVTDGNPAFPERFEGLINNNLTITGIHTLGKGLVVEYTKK